MRAWLWAGTVGGVAIAIALVGACGLESAGQLASDAGVDQSLVDGAPDSPPPPDAESDAAIDVGPIDAGVDASPLAPGEVPGLAFWVRGDKGLELEDGGTLDGGAVVAWRDLADAGPAHDLLPVAPPPRGDVSSNYAGQPGVTFGTNDTGRLFNPTLVVPQPMTVLLVGHAGTDVSYFFDSNTATRASILTTTGKKLVLVTSGGSYAPPGGGPVAGTPSVIVAIFNGAQSRLFVSSDTGTGAINPGAIGIGGVSLGNYQGGLYGLGGTIVEAAIWNVALDALSVKRLNAYAGQRYGITIKP